MIYMIDDEKRPDGVQPAVALGMDGRNVNKLDSCSVNTSRREK